MEIVLQYIKTRWYDNPSLIAANLICKFTTLLVLTIASRASMIQQFDTEFMAKVKEKYIFYFIYFILFVKISHYG